MEHRPGAIGSAACAIPVGRRNFLRLSGLGLGGLLAAPLRAAGKGGFNPFGTVSGIARGLRSGSYTSSEITEAMLRRIERIDQGLKSYIALTADLALEAARAADLRFQSGNPKGPLDGVPIGIKDLIDLAGYPTGAGTVVLAQAKASANATVAQRLIDQGAVILGKHALCEGALGPYHPDLPVPVNPWDETRWSGVSSSGSGVAVAAGLCFGSIGSDTGGSIRYPSAANGCVGFKPSFGRISVSGVVPLAPSLDHLGPMARSVKDAALLYLATAGYDRADPMSLNRPAGFALGDLEKGVRGLRIGVDEAYCFDRVQPRIQQAVQEALCALEDAGALIARVEMPDVEQSGAIWWLISMSETAAWHKKTFEASPQIYGPGFGSDLRLAEKFTAPQIGQAISDRERITGALDALLSDVDVMIAPTMAKAAQPGLADPSRLSDEQWHRLVGRDSYSKPFNFSGVPCACVPAGFDDQGLPVSVQFVARRFRDDLALRVAHGYELATGWTRYHPATG